MKMFLKRFVLQNSIKFDHLLRSLSNNTTYNTYSQRKFSSSSHSSLTSEHDGNVDHDFFEKECQKSLKEKDFFHVNKLINMQEMFDARVYLGHKEGTLNPYMKPYIFGSRLGHLILDLDQTFLLLQEALNFAAHIAFRNGIILFINKSASTGHLVEKTAKNCGEYSHCRDWKIGTFTDSTTFFEAVTRLPDLVIFLNTMNNVFETHPAVRESAKLMIPTIGVVDTNSDPCLISFPLPGNDDSPQSVAYFCSLFEKAINLGKQKRMECLQKNDTDISNN